MILKLILSLKDFLRRYKCSSDHWIGLKMAKNRTGQWVDGAKFKNSFVTKGSEGCAYLSDDGAATARCYTERKWICRQKIHEVNVLDNRETKSKIIKDETNKVFFQLNKVEVLYLSG
uniref:C-type lectin domain-containing protein n=1 Tax=Saimiri boliviensis boliviensis TaxID=39432 RepID=A0A2K6UKB2_SAIBB